MEAYFHSEPRIEEWVNQIIENIVAVEELTGADSEVEFEKGREIVTNLTQLLQGISIFPSEYLEDGLKQLLEQQIPGSEATNILAFQDTMNKMLREGMIRAIDKQDKAEDVREKAGENTSSFMNEFENELVTEMAITALASAKVHEPVDHLKTVLTNMFPNVPVCWNFNLMDHTFLAQVEDILIWQHDPDRPCDVVTLKKEGWKVYECSSNDLLFPRRVERGIRQILRLGKYARNG